MNVSSQLTTTASEDTVSMYLSFDDSCSNFSYKSVKSNGKLETEDHNDDSKENKTLEPQDDEEFCNTMKELSNVLAPLRSQSVTILREFNVVSSTPSKSEHNLDKEKEVTLRRSLRLKENSNANVEDCSDGIKENDPSLDENTIPTESVICQKAEQSLSEEKKENEENTPNLKLKSMIPTSLKRQKSGSKSHSEKKVQKKMISVAFASQIKPPTENGNKPNEVGSSSSKIAEQSKSKTVEKKEKMHSVVRQSRCEPNLEANRPSRIIPKKGTRYSVNPSDAVNVARAAWPGHNKFGGSKDGKKIELMNGVTMPQKPANFAARQSLNPSTYKPGAIGGRKSLLPSMSIAPQRGPTVVKTTLNSSTRKVAPRRSVLLLQNKLGSSPMLGRKKVAYRISSATSSEEAIAMTRTAGGGTLSRKSTYNPKTEIKFTCSDCGSTYNTKTLLETHKRTHLKAIQEIRKTRALGLSTNNAPAVASNVSNNRCKYCDKSFAIERALHIHLMQHCVKIPAIERRKLNFDEMNHVVKADIPHFRQPTKDTAITATMDPLINLPVKTNADKFENNFKSLRSKMENILKNEEQTSILSGSSAKSQMGPPSSTKLKKRSAHSGVSRTPNKEIPCMTCRQTFKNIIDYTNHMMTAHITISSSNNIDSDQID